MPIIFSCACGKRLKVSDEKAGKKVRCPTCQEVVQVPKKAPSPVAAAPPGAAIKAKPPSRPQPKDAVQAGRTPHPTAAMDETIDDDEVKPRKGSGKKKRKKPEVKSGRGLYLALGGGALALILVAVLVWILWPTGQKTAAKGVQAAQGGPKSVAENVSDAQASGTDLIPSDALAIASLRPAALWQSTPAKALQATGLEALGAAEMRKATSLEPKDIERITLVIPNLSEKEMMKIPDVSWVQVSTTTPYDCEKLLRALTGEAKSNPPTYQGKTYYPIMNPWFTEGGPVLYPVNSRLFVVAKAEAVKRLIDQAGKATTTGPMKEALQQSAAETLVVLLGSGVFKGLAASGVPPQFQPLLSVQFARLAVNESSVNVRLDCPDDATAGAARDLLLQFRTMGQQALAGLAQNPMPAASDEAQMAKKADELLQAVQVEVKQKSVHLNLKGEAVTAAVTTLAPALQRSITKMQESTVRLQLANNMKQVVLAFHSHNDVYKKLPQPSVGAGLSWRVAILPYIGEENLYKRFNLNEAWDSPHNKKLLPFMPKVYAPVGTTTAPPDSTFLQLVTGPGTLHPTPTSSAAIPQSFRDGTSNTILVVEAAEAVPWTKPADFHIDVSNIEAGVVPKLGAFSPLGFFAALADGSVRFIPRPAVSDKTLRQAFNPADGMVLGADWNQ
jgi:hypothetical protein